jgi:hypothetical protein
VFCDNELKARNILRGEALQRLEQPPNRLKVRIFLAFRLLNRATGGCIGSLGREVDLSWLVDQHEPGNGMVVRRRKPMKRQQRSEMVRQMVFTTSGSIHVNWAARSVDDNCQIMEIETSRILAELAPQVANIARHVQRDVAERGSEVCLGIIGTELSSKSATRALSRRSSA